ncbi:MAG TPA: lipid A biosynthesis lauroyl acyltransferase [Gammaproteobacteria bacterium]|nr:lipid A biosynthesis lauroyl acyltransferase [Gammaproteobacteria bacterium]
MKKALGGATRPGKQRWESADSSMKYYAPRYWPVWGFWLWLRLTAALPLGLALRIHESLGALVYRLAGKQRRLVQRNIELCFPELAAPEVDRLALRHFAALGASVAESAIAWFTPDRRLAGRFDILGREHLNDAIAAGRGVILFTGHFTTLELCGRPFKSLTPLFACMFSHRSNPLLDEIQFRGRLRSAHEAASSDDVRALLRSLKRNAVIWYAPDQFYRGPNAELIPFFHELAMTNVATSKLARVSGAALVPFSYRRLEGQARYELRFHAPLEGIPSEDPAEDTRRLFRVLERFIRACPEQYLWLHKKFKGRPAPLPDLYGRARVDRGRAAAGPS